MISLVQGVLPSSLQGQDPLTGRLLAWWEAYHDTSFARFYRTENDGCIALMDAQAIAYIPAEDAEEAASFFAWQPQIQSVVTNVPDCFTGKVTNFPCMLAPEFSVEEQLEPVRLEQLYTFLRAYFSDLPPFEAWYLDVSYRTRHDFCRHAVLTDNGQIVASVMTTAEWRGGALLGGVATHPGFRRRGLAGRLVTNMTACLQKMGKTVWICPYNPPAQRLYESLGFRTVGSITIVERM